MDLSGPVPSPFGRGKDLGVSVVVGFQDLLDGAQQKLAVDEGDLNDGLPGLSLAVRIRAELVRVVLDERRRRVDHQLAE